MVTFSLKVIGIKKETENTYTLSFKQPGLKKIKYLPGQYLTLIVNVNNRKYKRPYSFSSSPGVDSNLQITIKRVLHGVVSNHLIDVVKENDLIEVMPPMGDFYFDEIAHTGKEIYLWGGGSGITPLMSILKFVLQSDKTKVNLTLCNRSKKETIFLNELLLLQDKYSPDFKLNLFCTKEENSDTFFGRVDEKAITSIFKLDHLKSAIHFICGPSGLKETVKEGLINLNVESTAIHSEDFEHLISDVELEGIQTQMVYIKNNLGSTSIEVTRGKSILEASLDYGLDIPYSCQTGTCHLCKGKLISGEVKIIGTIDSNKILSDKEYLLCCSYPLTDNVAFKID